MTVIDTPTDAPLRAFLGYGLKRAFNAIQADLNETLRPHGLRMISFSALALIGAQAPIRQSRLAELLTIEPSNLVVILDELDRAGLIAKDRAPEDRRAYEIRLTETGGVVLQAARADVERHDQRMTRLIDPKEREIVLRALQTVEQQGRPDDD